jgi:hypothetical protein
MGRVKEVIMNPLLLLSVIVVSFFSFFAVAVWSDARRKEREAYYRSETLKKLAEGTGGTSAITFLREEDRLATRRRKEGMKVGGLITAVVGVGFMVFLGVVEREHGVWVLGLMPLGIGLALLLYAYVLAPKERGEADAQ